MRQVALRARRTMLAACLRSSYKSMIFSTIETLKLRGSGLKWRTFAHCFRFDSLRAR
jgi:hypothetical protein